jgi:hypothetical protein
MPFRIVLRDKSVSRIPAVDKAKIFVDEAKIACDNTLLDYGQSQTGIRGTFTVFARLI